MDRIMIIGSAGSGKSTLSQKLGKIFDLPVIHLDRHYWKPDWVATPNEEWDKAVEAFTLGEKWIIDGNYSRTLDARIRRADLIVYLDMPRWLCLYRVIKRRMMYHKKTRPDLNEECPERLDWEFVKWVWNYPKRSRMGTINKLEQVRNEKQILILKKRSQVEDLVHRLENKS